MMVYYLPYNSQNDNPYDEQKVFRLMYLFHLQYFYIMDFLYCFFIEEETIALQFHIWVKHIDI